MNKGGLLDDTLGQLGDLAKQTGKAIAQTPKDLAKTAAKQVGLEHGAEKGKEKPTQGSEAQKAAEDIRKQQNQDIVKSMYAPSEGAKSQKITPAQEAAAKLAQENPQKSPEEIQKITQLKQQLHQTTYYQPLVTPPKQQEEKPAEKVEREKIEELQLEREKEKKKPKSLAIDQSQNMEKHRGSSG